VNKGIPPLRLGKTTKAVTQLPATLMYNYTAALYNASHETPRSDKEAMKHPHHEKWCEIEYQELAQLEKLNVARLVPLPEGERLIPSKWVYNINREGVFKARFVARGDKQRPGEDYRETFANMVRPKTLSVFFLH
jgi:hypothetical protein